MKKFFIILLGCSFIFSVISGCSSVNEPSPLRMHVIANSNDRHDQEIKYEVRDAILEYTAPAASGFDSAEEVKKFVLDNEAGLHECVRAVLEKNDAGYDARIDVGVYYFPDKSYGDVVYGAGYYDAVEVVLGDGAGQNWWCVIFPPLCLITTEDGSLEGGSDSVSFGSLFAEMFSG